jgi:membrane protein YqaA with SNARE-associated domain
MNCFLIFIISFISATLFPLGSEALVLYNIKLCNLYLLFIFATFGNSLGSIFNYWIGLKGENYLMRKKILKKSNIFRSKQFFDKYGSFTILLSWMPIIGDPITFIAGALRYNFKKFVILVFIAKGGRYLFLIMSYKLVFVE